MNITNEEKSLLAKLASGALDGVAGEETSCAEYKGTYHGQFIKGGEPVYYIQNEWPRFSNGKENMQIPSKRAEESFITDEEKLSFLQKYGWLMDDEDARKYSMKFRSEKRS
ncbi:hypothetical protein [Ruminococcus sp. FC2018]|uniref:hypothetical protein n=1 Tax=Ruminococcus sp. FC2018 TaxID=1410617 RepID=UPI00049073FF|nr:hypothetical protein [Ruminococcus sp. FC2018]